MSTQQIPGPSLIYPLGKEVITDNIINITWQEPSVINNLVWIEILFTDSFYNRKNIEWKQIALIPSQVLSYQWKVTTIIRGDKCRIGIRAINHKGEKSDISYSADNFTIQEKRVPVPSVLEPVSNSSYFSFMPIILDKASMVGRISQKAYYNVYYACNSQNIDWTLFKYGISIDSGPIYLDIKNLPTATDYEVKIELTDGYIVSVPVFIKDITINSFNYFIIDTVPPTGVVKIINNKEYTKDRDIVLQLTAYDETTGVESFQIEQLELNQNSTVSTSPVFEKMTNLSTWHIQGDDGAKLVQARFRDFAGNVFENDGNVEFFRTYVAKDNNAVTSFVTDGIDYWSTFNSTPPVLYKNTTQVTTLAGSATVMAFYDDVLYIAIKDEVNNGILQKYVTGNIVTIGLLSEQSEIATRQIDCVINTMFVYDNKLFMGLQNGLLYFYDGSIISLANENNLFSSSINKIYGNEACLFIFLDNSKMMTIMTKNEISGYDFTEAEVGI